MHMLIADRDITGIGAFARAGPALPLPVQGRGPFRARR